MAELHLQVLEDLCREVLRLVQLDLVIDERRRVLARKVRRNARVNEDLVLFTSEKMTCSNSGTHIRDNTVESPHVQAEKKRDAESSTQASLSRAASSSTGGAGSVAVASSLRGEIGFGEAGSIGGGSGIRGVGRR